MAGLEDFLAGFTGSLAKQFNEKAELEKRKKEQEQDFALYERKLRLQKMIDDEAEKTKPARRRLNRETKQWEVYNSLDQKIRDVPATADELKLAENEILKSDYDLQDAGNKQTISDYEAATVEERYKTDQESKTAASALNRAAALESEERRKKMEAQRKAVEGGKPDPYKALPTLPLSVLAKLTDDRMQEAKKMWLEDNEALELDQLLSEANAIATRDPEEYRRRLDTINEIVTEIIKERQAAEEAEKKAKKK